LIPLVYVELKCALTIRRARLVKLLSNTCRFFDGQVDLPHPSLALIEAFVLGFWKIAHQRSIFHTASYYWLWINFKSLIVPLVLTRTLETLNLQRVLKSYSCVVIKFVKAIHALLQERG